MAAYLQTDEIAAGSPSSAVSSNSTIDENDVAKVLERRLESKNFKLIAWNLKPVGKQMGFGGSYFHLSAVVHFHGETSSFRFFVKTPPDRQSVQYEFFTRFDTFNKEITFYEDVMKFLGAGSRAKWLPHCYLGKRDVAIVLEDAVMENYRLADKYLPFDHKHCLVVLKTLANLHGRSIIAEEKLKERNNNSESHPSNMRDLYPILAQEVVVSTDDMGVEWRKSSLISALRQIDAVCENDKLAQLAKSRLVKWCDCYPDYFNPSRKYRNVIVHRDVWANNVLFKMNQQNEPITCILIDYQLCRYSPPALDIAMALHFTSDRKTRGDFERLARAYHEELGAVLREGGLEVDDCLPFEELKASLSDALHVGLVYSMLAISIHMFSDELMNSIFERQSNEMLKQIMYGENRYELVVKHHMEQFPHYRKRIAEVVEEVVECLPETPFEW